MNDSESKSSLLMLPNASAQAQQQQQQQQQQQHHSSTTRLALCSGSQHQQHSNQPTTTTAASPLLIDRNNLNHHPARNDDDNNNNNDMNTRIPESSSLSSLPLLPPPPERSNTSSFTATILDAPILDDYLLGYVLLSKLKWIAMELFKSINNNDNNNDDDDHNNHGLMAVAAAGRRRFGTFLVSLLLYPAIHLATTLATHGQTPAVHILGLERKLVTLNKSNNMTILQRRKRRQEQQRARLVLFSLCTTLGPVILHALKDALIRLQQQYQQRQRQRQLQLLVAPSQHQQQTLLEQQQLAAHRQFQMATHLLQILNRIVPLVQLALVLQCWNNNKTSRYNTSELAMMLTGFTYQNQQQQQQQQQPYEAQATPSSLSTSLPPLTIVVEPLLHVTYAHRRWLWDEMARTAQLWTRGLTLLIPIWKPLLQRYFQQWRRRCRSCLLLLYSCSLLTRKSITSMSGKEEEEESSSSSIDNHDDDRNLFQQQKQQQSSCPICHAQPITVPVTTDCCGHAYCYVCLYQESMISFGHHHVACRICGQSISSCQRAMIYRREKKSAR